MRVLVVTGATGVGKTKVAAALAVLTPIEIVSADSRQIYRGLDVGTAKPAATERVAPYHGLDLVAPAERYSAGRFAEQAASWIAEIAARARLPVVVGGTGFYLKALFEGLFDEPPLDEARRDRLRVALAALDAPELARWAGRLGAARGRAGGGGGRQRAARAVEVALLTGRPLETWQREAPPAPSGLEPWYALLELPREVLARRIAERVHAMLAAGLVDEVKRALEAGVARSAPGLSGVGYREVVAHLAGRLSAGELPGAMAAATRRYAKRQETWFRHQLRGAVERFEASGPPEAVAREVLARYRAAT